MVTGGVGMIVRMFVMGVRGHESPSVAAEVGRG
jgi:hypothetical protein